MSQSSTLPPFYVEPVGLSSQHHADWRLLPGDAGFASATPALPLTVGEFAAASRSYPILFATGGGPIALVGLDNANLFVVGGRWVEGAYVPAYVRRHPFLLIEATDRSGFALGIDAASPRVARSGEAGLPFFEDGLPTVMTRQALEFCRLFNVDHQQTAAFRAALTKADLLVERRADAEWRDGRRLGVHGFQVIDPERFAALDETVVIEWHRKGWLALAQFHLASLQRFADLFARRDALETSPIEKPSSPALTESPAEPSTRQLQTKAPAAPRPRARQERPVHDS